ncbi:DUF7660 family protein [Streptomyces sp. NPDC054766]|uniref:DUF7660 family protein n=1 Tax=Streptomyces rhizosphaerihabitans TaxID=1266770 RepID=UPI0021BF2AA7|nr:hypothetical protein [Streptomyces rhizosphaerihabitans]MCT9006616.1 hypothetical protein [Streptomyces rhizosphaerihabitans]
MDIPSAENVKSYKDLAAYIHLLVERIDDGSIRVENPQTVDYLGAAGSWVSSLRGYYLNSAGTPVPEQPDWELIAVILSAALIYE